MVGGGGLSRQIGTNPRQLEKARQGRHGVVSRYGSRRPLPVGLALRQSPGKKVKPGENPAKSCQRLSPNTSRVFALPPQVGPIRSRRTPRGDPRKQRKPAWRASGNVRAHPLRPGPRIQGLTELSGQAATDSPHQQQMQPPLLARTDMRRAELRGLPRSARRHRSPGRPPAAPGAATQAGRPTPSNHHISDEALAGAAGGLFRCPPHTLGRGGAPRFRIALGHAGPLSRKRLPAGSLASRIGLAERGSPAPSCSCGPPRADVVRGGPITRAWRRPRFPSVGCAVSPAGRKGGHGAERGAGAR